MKRKTALVLMALAATLAVAQQSGGDQTPSFSAFKVPEYKKKPAPAKILTRFDRQFRAAIREGARKGPNFAGHFTIVSWGCGTGCNSFVIVDAASGQIYWTAPFSTIGMPYEGAKSGREYGGLDYKADSRLLVADGCPEDDNDKCGTHYYEWRNGSFRSIQFKPDPPVEKIPG
jgi:hypothetical protein